MTIQRVTVLPCCPRHLNADYCVHTLPEYLIVTRRASRRIPRDVAQLIAAARAGELSGRIIA